MTEEPAPLPNAEADKSPASGTNPANTPKVATPREQTPKPPPTPELPKPLNDRLVPPLESTTVTLEIHGIFSLPEAWKTKV